jgi:hypothetical protein
MQRTSSTKRSISTPGTACGIKPHRLPPDGFNPRAASPLELRRYGLPRRSDPAIRPKLRLAGMRFSPASSPISRPPSGQCRS